MAKKTSFTVFMWNVAGIKHHISRVPFRKIIPYFEENISDINFLQELFFAKDRLKRVNDCHEHEIIPPNNKGSTAEYNDAVIITKFPILEKGYIRFKNVLNSTNASWATLKIGNKKVRVYNCHFEVSNIGIKERLDYLNKIISHANKTTLPTIICGDMNTTIPKKGLGRFLAKLVHHPPKESFIVDGKYVSKDERYVFLSEAQKHGFEDAFDIKKATWCITHTKIPYPNLKLDWFFTRGITARLEKRGPFISDHRPFNLFCELDD